MVIHIKYLVFYSPIYLSLFLFYTYKKIKKNHILHELRFGTFYFEFKNNKGLLSIFFYVFYFTRRLQFMLTQILFEDFEIIQNLLNLFTSYAMLGFMFYYKPFRHVSILMSNIASEMAFSWIFSILLVYSCSDNSMTEKVFQYLVILSVLLCMGFQFCISCLEFYKKCKEVYQMWMESRKKFNQKESKRSRHYSGLVIKDIS